MASNRSGALRRELDSTATGRAAPRNRTRSARRNAPAVGQRAELTLATAWPVSSSAVP